MPASLNGLGDSVRHFICGSAAMTLGAASSTGPFERALSALASESPRGARRPVPDRITMLALEGLGLLRRRDARPWPSPLITWARETGLGQNLVEWIRSSKEVSGLIPRVLGRATKETRRPSAFRIWDELYSNEASTRTSTLAFEWIARLTGMHIATSMSPLPTRILDVGSGSAGMLAELLRANPLASGVAVDFEKPLRFAKQLASRLGLSKRLTAIAADATDLPFEEQFDLVLLSWVLHDYDDMYAARLLRGLAEHLKPDGRVLVIELLRDSAPSYYSSALEIDIRLLGSRGRERTLSEYARLARRAGLEVAGTAPNIDFRSLLTLRHTSAFGRATIPRGELSIDRASRACRLILETAKKHDCWAAIQFGSKAHDRAKLRSDTDIAVVLRRQRNFSAALRSICELIHDWSLRIRSTVVYPTLELSSLRGSDGPALGQPVHLLLYADPWCLARIESPGVRSAILAAAGNISVPRGVAPSIRLHFDLLQKSANALVVLLGAKPSESAQLMSHARKIATYVSRWAPYSRTPASVRPRFRTMAGAIAYFRSVATQCEDAQ